MVNHHGRVFTHPGSRGITTSGFGTDVGKPVKDSQPQSLL